MPTTNSEYQPQISQAIGKRRRPPPMLLEEGFFTDPKVVTLTKELGRAAVSDLLQLWSIIWNSPGCFLKKRFLPGVADRMRIGEADLQRLIDTCIELELLSQTKTEIFHEALSRNREAWEQKSQTYANNRKAKQPLSNEPQAVPSRTHDTETVSDPVSVSDPVVIDLQMIKLRKTQFTALLVNYCHGDEAFLRNQIQLADASWRENKRMPPADPKAAMEKWILRGRNEFNILPGHQNAGRKKSNHELNMELLAKTMAEEETAADDKN